MSHQEDSGKGGQHQSLTARIDRLCDEFENAWQQGRRPLLTNYLHQMQECDHGPLLRELLGVDIEYRRAAGETPTAIDYKVQFPKYASLIDDSFSAFWSTTTHEGADESTIVLLFRHAASLDKRKRTEFLSRLPEQTRILVQRLLEADGDVAGKFAADPEKVSSSMDRTEIGGVSTEESTWFEDESVSSGHIGGSGGGDEFKGDSPKRRFGPYIVTHSLASGAFGDVFRCHDERLSRDVAVKVPRFDTVNEEVVEQFQQEAKQLAQLDHSSIVKVHDFGFAEGICYIVSEFVPGPDLNQWCTESRRHWIEICHVVVQISDALAYAHSRKTVHRDIKPANVRLKEDGRPVVLDFGLAISTSLGNAVEGILAGTPSYMSPEQIQAKAHRIDGRTDIYSLGVLLYRMLTGQLPFQSRNRDDLFREILHDDPQPPRQLDHDIPSELERICLKAMNRQMDGRYSTAADMARELRALLNAEGVDSVQGSWRSNSHSATIVMRRPRWGWRQRTLGLLAVAAIVGITAVMWPDSVPRAEESAEMRESGAVTDVSPRQPNRENQDSDHTEVVQELLQRLTQARQNMSEAQTWQLQGSLQQARGQLDSVLDDLDYVLGHEAWSSIPESDQNDTRLRWVTGMIRYCATIDHSSPADAAAADENIQITIAQIHEWLANSNESMGTDLKAALGMALAVRAELNCFAPGLDRQSAVSIADTAIRELRELPRNTTDAFFRRELAHSLKVLGRVEAALHRYADAAEDLQRALTIFESLVQLEESVGNVDLDYLIGKAETLALLAGLMDKLGRKSEAKERFAEGIRDFQQLAEMAPLVAGLDTQRVSLQANFAAFLQSLGLSTVARPELEEALSIFENMPVDLRSRSRLQELSLRSLLAEVILDCGKVELARRHAADAITGLEEHPDDPQYVRELALARMVAGRAECALQNYEEAEALLSSAAAACQILRGRNSTDDFFIDLLAWAYEHLGRVQLQAGNTEVATESFRDAYSLRKKLAAGGKEAYVLELARFLANCELESMRQPEEALRYLAEIESTVVDRDAFRRHLAMSLYRAGRWNEVTSLLSSDATESLADLSSESFVLATSYAQLDDAESAAEAFRVGQGHVQRNRPGARDVLRLESEAAGLIGGNQDAQ